MTRELNNILGTEATELNPRISALETIGATGMLPRAAADLATTGNITLSGEQTVDGTLTSGSDVLVQAQTNPAQNGPYTTGGGAWVRRADMNEAGEIARSSVYVSGGTVNGGSTFFTASEVVTLGTDPIVWQQISDQSALQVQIAAVDDRTSQLEADNLSWVAKVSDGAGSWVLPVCDIDLDTQQCWINGRIKKYDDQLTVNGDGSLQFIEIPGGLGTNDGSGFCVAIDVSFDPRYTEANAPSGCPFSWIGQSNNSRFELYVQQVTSAANTPPSGTHNVTGGFLSYTSTSLATSRNFEGTGDYTERSEGIRRYLFNVPASGATKGMRNCSYPVVGASVTGTFPVPTTITIGKRGAPVNDQLLTNATVHRVIIYNTDLTADQFDELGTVNKYNLPPLFVFGDSLANAGQPAAALRLNTLDWGYIPIHSDGKGGRGLSYFKDFVDDRIADFPKLANYVPILFEGGLDYSSLDYATGLTMSAVYTDHEIVEYLRDIFDAFTPSQKILLAWHTNSASVQQIANTTTTAATNTWVEARDPGAVFRDYIIRNSGPATVEYLVQSTLPSGGDNGTIVSLGEWTAPIATDGTASQNLYIRTTRAGDTASVETCWTAQALLWRLNNTTAHVLDAFGDIWCDWQGLARIEADDNEHYLTLRETQQTPTDLQLDWIHINWTRIDTSNDPGGYDIVGRALKTRLGQMGLAPRRLR